MTGTNKDIISGDWNAWADIVIKTWRQKMISMRIGQYRNNRKVKHEPLLLSFQRHVTSMAGGQAQTIDFLFKQYGIFVEMGVGREVSRGNDGNLSEYATDVSENGSKRLKRRRKPWFNKTWYSEVMKLREHMAEKMGQAAANEIMFGLQTQISGSLSDKAVPANISERNIALTKL